MEQGLRLWKQLFGRMREVDYEDFQEIFHSFVKDYGDSVLDEYQMQYIRSLVDPDKQFRVSISDFLVFFISFWSVPSKRKLVFDYAFSIIEETSKSISYNDFEYVTLRIENKSGKSPIKYLQTGSTIDIYRDRIVLLGKDVQQLNKLDVLRMGSDVRSERNDVIFTEDSEIQPIHCKIGMGTSGYFVKDQSKRLNRMRFMIGCEKPLLLDYKMVLEFGTSGCRFRVKRIFPEPVYDALNNNLANYVFTGQSSLETELENFQQKSSKKHFLNVMEWRQEQIQDKRNQKIALETQKETAYDISLELECFEGGGDLNGQTFSLKNISSILTIGRDKASDIQIKHVSISQTHATIAYNKFYASWIIKEPAKTLGSFVYLANYDQLTSNTSSNFHLIQQGLPFRLHDYTFHPVLHYKSPEDF